MAVHFMAVAVVVPVTGGAAEQQEALRCEPERLGAEGVLTLHMTVPHGPYLAVRDESGMLSFVIYPRPEGGKPSLMPAAAFRRVRTLELRPSTPGWPWVAGRDDPEPIFPASGRYTIVLSENLESHGYPQHRCTVEYVERDGD